MTTTQLPISKFSVDPAKCIGCGACVRDCVSGILGLADGVACLLPEYDADCLGCQHCLAVCPTAAVSVGGCSPADSRIVKAFDPASLDNLIRSRRSVRQFAPGAVSEAEFRRILDTAANAPTGVNMRHRRFTAILDTSVMDAFRDKAARLVAANPQRLSEDVSWMVDMAKAWVDKGDDQICRGAPHLLVVSAGPDEACHVPDCLIAMAYFDLYAQANGIGTTWCGIIDTMMRAYPEIRQWLGLPDDHTLGYAMLFGPAGVTYPRTAQHRAEDVALVTMLGSV